METLPYRHPNRNIPTPSIKLRDYQLQALEKIEAAEKRGISRQLIQLATGGGKTIIFAELIRRRGGRALVLAHRDELIQQAVDKILMVMPDANVGVCKAERNELEADIIVASVQTLSRPSRLAQLPKSFATVVVDEAHHSAAESYRRILAHVGVCDAVD